MDNVSLNNNTYIIFIVSEWELEMSIQIDFVSVWKNPFFIQLSNKSTYRKIICEMK